ncbi:MAG: hypothetical protein ACRERE_32245 [Candidatus Entotheonellia bacterium]
MSRWRKLLGGQLIVLQNQIFTYLQQLSVNNSVKTGLDLLRQEHQPS